MASYTYKCVSCENEKILSHSMKENPEFKCDLCDSVMLKALPKTMTFMLKGTNWSGKNAKEKNYREGRRKEMGKRMVKNHEVPQVQPNYKGEVVDSWETAKNLAEKDGVDKNRYESQLKVVEDQKRKIEVKKEKLLRGDA